MNEQNKVLIIANHLADRVRGNKRPYGDLKWIVENCDWQYKASESELMEAYFAAINILKQSGVENAKRKPLTTLSKQQRSAMRRQGKELATMIEKFLNTPVEVTKSPIQTYSEGLAQIQIAIKSGKNLCCSTFFYPTFEQLNEWASLDEPNKVAFAYKFAQRFKPRDVLIEENIETIKADLESFI